MGGASSTPLVRANGTPLYVFGAGMNRPVKLAGREVEWTDVARAQNIQGIAFVVCVIEPDGHLSICAGSRGLPFMEDEIRAALATWRMTPVLVNGSPVAVAYTFAIVPGHPGFGSVDGVPAGSMPVLLGSTLRPGIDTVIPFGAGMNRPTRVSGRDVQYTREAREHSVEGTAFVRCVIEVDGRLTGCQLSKGLPFLDAEILAAVSTWRMTPVLHNGQAIRVSYSIPIRLGPEGSESPATTGGVIGGGLSGTPPATPP
jgi:TonB family protein